MRMKIHSRRKKKQRFCSVLGRRVEKIRTMTNNSNSTTSIILGVLSFLNCGERRWSG
jgi:hypothetical protein